MMDSGASHALYSCCWPLSRLGEAIAALGARAGLPVKEAAMPHAPSDLRERKLEAWIDAAADWLGMETEIASIPYPALGQRLPEAAPALLRVRGPGEPRFLALLSGGRGYVRLLTPHAEVRRHKSDEVAELLSADRTASLTPSIEALFSEIDFPASRKQRIRRAILDEQLRAEDFTGVWLLRPHTSTSFTLQVGHARLWPRLALLVLAHAAEYVCLILAWWIIGQAALQGRVDRGLLWAWALLLLTTIPLTVLTTWLQGTIAIAGGAILKQRLLVGALRLDADDVRKEGAGHLLGRTLESEAVESLALSGGFTALVSVVELIMAVLVLSSGAAAVLEVPLLFVWTAVVLLLGWRCLKATTVWADGRLHLTHELVEKMIGHRTRLAQEAPERWHEGEDEGIERYLDTSRNLDRRSTTLSAIAARGWLLLAVAGVAVPFFTGSASATGLAITVGGALLGFRAFRRLATGLGSLAEAWVAWRQVSPLFHSGGRRDPAGVPDFMIRSEESAPASSRPVVQTRDLSFRYKTRSVPVLKGISLDIRAGDRVLLEGESGSGKSTLASLLVSMRPPDSGLLMAGGLDRHTLGLEGWRRRVASAPQFHENHIIVGTFAFNLLMARQWPPTKEDVALLEPLCAELGLDALLKRMPGGLMQMVGESGWQLSHGEKSRVFLARALLQDADLVILDESFAALDPENLKRSLECVKKRAKSLLVIAHR
jgi:ABC-type multidrug transport system fused ATPase/permease subunit